MKTKTGNSTNVYLRGKWAATAITVFATATAGSIALAQDASYPYAPMNPFVQIAPPPSNPPGQQGTALPWPWNPLGTPAAPLPNQTIPESQVPTPTISPPPNLVTPNPMPRDAAINPFGQSVAPGYAPEPSGDRGQPGTQSAANAPATAPSLSNPLINPPGTKPESEKKTGGKKEEEKASSKEKPLIEDKKPKQAKKGKETQDEKGGKESDQSKEDVQAKEGAPAAVGKGEAKAKKQEFASAAPLYDPIREALFQLNSKQFARSLETLNKVLTNNPNHPQAHYVRAIVYVMMRQYLYAVKDYKEVLRLTPNSDLGRRAAEGLKKISL